MYYGKVILSMELGKAKVEVSQIMAYHFEISRTIKRKGMQSMSSTMVLSLRDFMRMDLNADLENIVLETEDHMRENLKRKKEMALEYINGRAETFGLETGIMTSEKEEV